MLNERLKDSTYLIRRDVWKLKLFVGECRVYDSAGRFCFLADQKGWGAKRDIRVYTDEDKQDEVMAITSKQLLGFSAAYDVTDTTTGEKVGALRRRGLKSMVRDEWAIMNAEDVEIGTIKEDNAVLALLRRFLTNLIPQKYEAEVDGSTVCTLRQNLNPFALKLTVDFSPDEYTKALDRRLGLAAAVLLCAVEGRER